MASRASLGPATSLNAIDALDGDDVVPSFTFAVAALFAYPLQDEVAPAGEPPPSPLSGGESPGPRASWFLIFTAGFSAEDDGHACRKLRVGYVSFSMGGDGGMNPEVLRVPVENNVFHRLELLKRSQNDRRRFREFFVEGVKGIKQARAHGWPIRSLVYASGRPLSSWGRDMLAATPEATPIELSPALMDRLSDKHEPSELVAIVGMPPDSPGRIKPSAEALVAVVDRPSTPGNLGSIIRSSHALGADGVIVTGSGTDIYHPLTVRASMGSLFVLPTVRLESHVELASWVRELATAHGRPGRDRGSKSRIHIVGASSDAGLPADTVDLTLPTVLVFGNEATGLSPEYQDLCDTLVRIPMHAEADSINVACAAAILLYEVDRQRRAKRRMPPRPWSRPRRDQGLRIDKEDGTPTRRP